MTQAFIFDLDGTLLDTLTSLADSYNRILETFGYPTHHEDAYRYFIGDGLRACVERCLPAEVQTQRLIQDFMTAQQQDYEQTWHTARPYPGISELIDSLAATTTPLAVLSNKNHAFTQKCIDHFFPGRFDVVQGYTGEFPHKPDPAVAFAVCKRLGHAPGDVVFVGDTATDIRTAVACGNKSVGVLWGFRDADELTAAGADRLIETPAELIEEHKA